MIDGLTLEHAVPARRRHRVPLLFVHGMWGGRWIFANYLAFAAARGWEAWAVDLRGHHGSRPVDALATVRLEDYVQDVHDALDAIGPAVVVGHSMGGLIAQTVAARRDVEAIVLIASAPPPGITPVRWSLAWRSLHYLADVLRPRAFVVRPADACALALNAIPPGARHAIARRLVEDSGLVARQLAFPPRAAPTPLRCPVLVVSATEDRLIPASVQRRIAERYRADHIAVAGGHMLPIEPHWRGPMTRILAWLRKLASGYIAIYDSSP